MRLIRAAEVGCGDGGELAGDTPLGSGPNGGEGNINEEADTLTAHQIDHLPAHVYSNDEEKLVIPFDIDTVANVWDASWGLMAASDACRVTAVDHPVDAIRANPSAVILGDPHRSPVTFVNRR
jgi:hypothetical protein